MGDLAAHPREWREAAGRERARALGSFLVRNGRLPLACAFLLLLGSSACELIADFDEGKLEQSRTIGPTPIPELDGSAIVADGSIIDDASLVRPAMPDAGDAALDSALADGASPGDAGEQGDGATPTDAAEPSDASAADANAADGSALEDASVADASLPSDASADAAATADAAASDASLDAGGTDATL